MNLDILNETAVCYGEILWDVLPDGPQPGGAPLNVAYHLNKFGVHTGIISKIGNDNKGKSLIKLLDEWGISQRMIQVDDMYPTSEVIAKMSADNEVSYEIVFPVAWDFIIVNESIIKQVETAKYLIFGSLSSRNEVSRASLHTLFNTPAIKVLDVNLRPPYVNSDYLQALLKETDIVKFNQQELEMAQALFGGVFQNEYHQVKFIRERFEINEVIVTKGQYGASYYKGHEVYSATGTEIVVNDTIGSGDAFLAAFIANHHLNDSPQNLINNAVAMGAFVATKKGGCPEYELSEYTDFKHQLI